MTNLALKNLPLSVLSTTLTVGPLMSNRGAGEFRWNSRDFGDVAYRIV